MARMPDGFIDLTVTSPPYDDLREYHGCEWNLKIFQQVAQELYRVTKPGGVVVWVVNDKTENGSETLTSFLQAIYFRFFAGFLQHDTMIYKKKNPPPQNHNRLDQSFEYVFCFSKCKPSTFNPLYELTIYNGMVKNRGLERKSALDNKSVSRLRPEKTIVKAKKLRTNILEYAVGVEPEFETGDHTAIFPSDLAKEQIFMWSNEGDLVYDPFGGSGTTAKMAHIMKRNWIMSEISEEYCKLAEKRLKPYLNQLDLAI